MIKQPHIIHLFPLLMLLASMAGPLTAQKINIQPSITSDLITATANLQALEFDFLVAGSENTHTIALTDSKAVAITVTSPEKYELTVWAGLPTALEHKHEPNATIPVSLRLAYSNNRETSIENAKINAVEVPVGFTSVTFPVVKRNSGPISPPLMPAYEGYTIPTENCYLFFYGHLGPASGKNVIAGNYSATVYITIDYATYD